MISNKHYFCDHRELKKCLWQFVTNYKLCRKFATEHELSNKSFLKMNANKHNLCDEHKLKKRPWWITNCNVRTNTSSATKVFVKWFQSNTTFVMTTNLRNVRDSSCKSCTKRANGHELCNKTFREMIPDKHNFCDQHELKKCSWQFVMNYKLRTKYANKHKISSKCFREIISNKHNFCAEHELKKNIGDSSWGMTKLCSKQANEHELCDKSFRELISNKHNFCDHRELKKCSWQFVTNYKFCTKCATKQELSDKSFCEMISNKHNIWD
jgi:hypothetical protein